MSNVLNYFHLLLGMNRNAKLFLIHTLISGFGFAFLVLLYNLYILSLGFKQDMIGLVTLVASAVAVVAALPMGILMNRIGYKRSLLIGIVGTGLSIALPLLVPTAEALIVTELIWGIVFTLLIIVGGPFMSENATKEQRAHLFSVQFTILTLTAFVGNWIGGELPRWFGNALGVAAESATAYQAALGLGVALMLVSSIPLAFLSEPMHHVERLVRPRFIVRNRGHVARLMSPQIVGAIGAGMFVPFANVFWKVSFNLGDGTIGNIFAISALIMTGAGILTPLLRRRWGSVRVMVIAQVIAVLGLLVFGFTSLFSLAVVGFLARDVLMNMTRPLWGQFQMDQSDPAERSAVSALSTMGFNLAWGIGSWISGVWQSQGQFTWVFGASAAFYLASLALLHGLFREHPADVIVSIGALAD